MLQRLASGRLSGWMQQSSLEEIWRGEVAVRHRSEAAAREYTSCSTLLCPYFHDEARGVSRRFPLYEPVDPERERSEAPNHPASLHLCNDTSCSLRCPSCRTGTVMARKAEQDRQKDFFLPRIVALLPKMKRIWITGSGDPFASKHYRELLAFLQSPEHRHITVDMQTNGVSVRRTGVGAVRLRRPPGGVIVSIDAGRPETYRKLRAGGDWERLMRNLAFLGRKRREGHIQHLRLDAVTQTCNFREIPEIVNIVQETGADQAYFSIITNWGHMSWTEFCSAFVFSPDHPQFGDFLDLYKNMRTDPLIDWGNLPRWTLTSSGATS